MKCSPAYIWDIVTVYYDCYSPPPPLPLPPFPYRSPTCWPPVQSVVLRLSRKSWELDWGKSCLPRPTLSLKEDWTQSMKGWVFQEVPPLASWSILYGFLLLYHYTDKMCLLQCIMCACSVYTQTGVCILFQYTQLLLKTLGQSLYNEFSERLRQLKFCEESLFWESLCWCGEQTEVIRLQL